MPSAEIVESTDSGRHRHRNHYSCLERSEWYLTKELTFGLGLEEQTEFCLLEKYEKDNLTEGVIWKGIEEWKDKTYLTIN